MRGFVLKGDICYSPSPREMITVKDGYAVCVDSKSRGVFSALPREYESLPIIDYTGKLIIPGLVDLHIHASQFAYRGNGMDLELLDWLQKYAFPEESKFENTDYAQRAYGIFADAMKKSATTHACIFASRHVEATEILMEQLDNAGLVSYVGKVNMDSEAPAPLCEISAEASAEDTVRWLERTCNKFNSTYPMITPRFVPSCSAELLNKLGEIRTRYGVAVQSHLSENRGEIAFVHELFPDAKFYGEVYDNAGLFGKDRTTGENFATVMAHCVYSSDEELKMMKEQGVFIVHCPASNTNVSSGIAPVRRYLELGMDIGLGSDVAGGHTESMLRAICDTVQVSKLYWRLIDDSAKQLTFREAFYLATKGGGKFFGKVGSFENGYDFTAVVLDDSSLRRPVEVSLEARMECAAYNAIDMYAVCAKYIGNKTVYKNT